MMRSSLLLLLVCATGCPKAPVRSGDPTLPEAVDTIAAKTPHAELEAGAASLDPALRARSLHLLVLTSDDVQAWTLGALYDPSEWVQRSAIMALAQRPDGQEGLTRFAEHAQVEPTARALAALELPRGAVDLVSAYQRSSSPWERLPLALAAWHHGDAAALDVIHAALRTGELPLDLQLMDTLVTHGDPSLLESLAVAQERSEPELSTALAATRLRLGDASGEVELRQALGGDPHEQMEVLDQLATWDDPVATALIRKAQATGPDLVRTHAALLLTARTAQQTQRLEAALEDSDREVRLLGVEAASQALSHGPAHRNLARTAVEVLRQGATDLDPTVRAAAARALGVHGGVRHLDVLEPLLEDEVQQVRIEAAGALLRG